MEMEVHYNFFPLKEKWKKLYADNHQLSAYQSEEYASIAFSHYIPYAVRLGVMPVFYEVIENGVTIMIIPLCRNVFNKEYMLFGDRSGYGYTDFIYSKNMSHDRMEECLSQLGRQLRGSRLNINRLREDSLLCLHLRQKFAPSGAENCAHIDLPDSYDVYLASLKKEWRHHIHTAYNRLENEQKTVSLKTYCRQPLPDDERTQMLDLYLRRREIRYGQKNSLLYKIFLKNFDIGSVAMKKMVDYAHFILYIDDRAVAFCSGFISGENGTITLPRLAIDAEYAAYSPGILLLNESIKKIIEMGIADKIDLIEGDERYKHEVGGKLHNCYGFELMF